MAKAYAAAVAAACTKELLGEIEPALVEGTPDVIIYPRFGISLCAARYSGKLTGSELRKASPSYKIELIKSFKITLRLSRSDY